MQTRDIESIDSIIVHCSDSDIKSHDNIDIIRSWHIERGFDDIGYNYVVTKDGEVHIGRGLKFVGAHCRGKNQTSIGICLAGRNEFSKIQLHAFKILTVDLCNLYGLDYGSQVYPHNYYNKGKTCPNFDINQVLYSKEENHA